MQPEIDTSTIDIPLSVQESWQKSIDLIARIAEVPAALVMRVHATEIEVFRASDTEGNPYQPGERAALNTGLYCETVMANRQRLLVPNALIDPDWDHNPDLALNMISYMGWPILWPNGDVFGTICLLDTKENAYDATKSALLYQFKELIEFSLRSIYEQIALELSQKTAKKLDRDCHRYQKLAATDSLTRLYNRRAFLELGRDLFRRLYRERTPVAILMIDIDHFKTINDRYNHETGDQALIETARLLTTLSRRCDILARFGGDEFILLVPEIPPATACTFATRIVESIQHHPIKTQGISITLTLSIGVYACIPDCDDGLEDAIRQADQALLAAKAQGRNQAVCRGEADSADMAS